MTSRSSGPLGRTRTYAPWGATLVSLLAVVSLSACSSTTSSETTAPSSAAEAPAASAESSPDAPSSEPAASESAVATGGIQGLPEQAPAGSLDGKTIGYFNYQGDPFIDATTADVKAQIEAAGGKMSFCLVKDDATTLNCFRNFNSAGVSGIIGFNGNPNSVAALCAAGPEVPIVALYIPMGDCSKAAVTGDDAGAGESAGKALGDLAKKDFNCEIGAYVQLGDTSAGAVNTTRMDAIRKGYEGVCGPLPADKIKIGDQSKTSTTDAAKTYMANVLQAVPAGEPIMIAGLNDNSVLGAFAAGRSQNRSDDLWAVSIGAGADFLKDVSNPHWVASAAFFPEAFGRVSVPKLVKLLNGEPVDEVTLMPTTAITAANVNDYYPGTIP